MLEAPDAPLPGLADAGLATCETEGGERARGFAPSKRVFLLSARVHPGETPASHVLNGALRFLLHPTDPRAAALRARFVFKLIPVLNPDGVFRGHYRSDGRGVNLNRVWANPTPEHHPSIYAAAALVRQLHAADRLRLFVDCHAHSNKRGCFLYGNALPDQLQLVEAVTYARLVEQNCRWFDFEGCTFSQASMSAKDPRDGAVGKEGSGRVGVYRSTGLPHTFTLECNYNTGRIVNRIAHPHAAEGLGGRGASLSPQPPLRCLHPKYTPETWHSVGKALFLAALDLHVANPCSRLGAPGDGAAAALARLRSTSAAWVRTAARAAKEKSAKKAAKDKKAAVEGLAGRPRSGGGSGGSGSDEDEDKEGPAVEADWKSMLATMRGDAVERKPAGRGERISAGSEENRSPLQSRATPVRAAPAAATSERAATALEPSAAAAAEAAAAAARARKREAAAARLIRDCYLRESESESSLGRRAAPFWADARGAPLVRRGFSLRTPPLGRLGAGARMQVLETRSMSDGALRAAVSLPGHAGEQHGWITLVARDGAENAAYVSPQPAPEPPSDEQRARDKAREAEPVAHREAPGGAMFVFCCNGRGCVFCDRF